MTDQPRRRVGAIDRTLQILDILTERQASMSTYELVRATGSPASTIYKITEELVERGMLTRMDANEVWLGPRLMRYGLTYRSKMDFFAAAKREMERLAERIDETIQVCARDEDMMTVIAMARGHGHFNVASDVGTRVPLNWTASGRLLVGHLSEAERLHIFRDCARPSGTGLAEIQPEKLAEISGREFRDRLSVQLSASEYSVACIAAPICDETGACVATISIVLPEARARANYAQLAEEVQNSASTIEVEIGRRVT
ncbi:IclR family transcriptional regulator [Oceaniovalibus sp. ACAM 378]|uniref:IclR family transcriptional regulator n=1 Tax=Oceaniovalibus sp. ACAM 378 TaxID=2599923 RepID=UPI0011DB9D62|nr:IclR family transcriptional regulator [Oceaniovalibus sp. ACAM 378]TYB84307.1 IclR family transcriptional regulator [Oceaniovalibus sp. ACAM 378]